MVWNNEPKILPIAFGMNKLQIGCVVEDAKVSVDDVYEKIESWEDLVQSIDTVSFQKLWFRCLLCFKLSFLILSILKLTKKSHLVNKKLTKTLKTINKQIMTA